MSKLEDYCRNPKCSKRFPKGNKDKSRPLPVDLVNVAAIDAYYDANPDKALHRSPKRVCTGCGAYKKNVKPPTWLAEHLLVYMPPPPFLILISLLIYCFSHTIIDIIIIIHIYSYRLIIFKLN